MNITYLHYVLLYCNVKEDDMIVLAILKRIKEKSLRSALRETDLNFDKCVCMCRATEHMIDDVPDIENIDTVNKLIQNCMFCHNRPKHMAGKCPAKGKKCNKCDLFGH